MTEVKVTSEDVKAMIEPVKAREIINILAELPPASAMINLSAIMATIAAAVCDDSNVEHTINELGRLTVDLARIGIDAVQNGKVPPTAPTWDAQRWGN